MGKSILITGGARSGKSGFAERLTLSRSGRGIYIATAEAGDREMAQRIAAHRARRGAAWTTVQEPLDLAGALRQSDGDAPRLVDCVTLWLSSLMLADRDWEAEVDALTRELARQSAPVVLVTNEVGAGIVPENALARRYRDAAGWTNQRLAAACDAVWLVAAGCPVQLKPGGPEPRLDPEGSDR